MGAAGKISPSSGRSRDRRKIKPSRSFFRLLSLTQEWEAPFLRVLSGKISPSRGRSRESGKIKPSGKIFRSPSLSKELLGPFLWVLPKRILKFPSSGRSWEGEKYKDRGKFSLVASKLMPQPDSTSEHGIKIDATLQKSSIFSFKAPKRSQLSDWFVTRLRFGARFHAKTPLIPLPQPSGLQNDIFSEKVFASRFRRCSSVCRRTFLVFSLHPLTATLRAEKRHGFLDFQKIFALRFHQWS